MSTFKGNKLQIEIWGASHSADIGVIVNGLPEGESVDMESVQAFCDRRRANNSSYSTARIEADRIQVLSGVQDGKLCGEFKARIENTNKRSNDYDNLKDVPRPSHADYVARAKYGADYDFRGGGHFSGRMTAPMCIVGGIAKELLAKKGIDVRAYISTIGKLNGGSYKTTAVENIDFDGMEQDFPLIDKSKRADMMEEIYNVKKYGNSIGGTIECVVQGLPVGVSDHMFDCLEGKIASMCFAVPAIKGVEFGMGFDISEMTGKDANDEMYFDDDGNVKMYSNNNGGILGGISNGMPLTLRVAVKPTASISMIQRSVNLVSKENVDLQIGGRHDACIVPRAVPVIEAVVAIALLDVME